MPSQVRCPHAPVLAQDNCFACEPADDGLAHTIPGHQQPNNRVCEEIVEARLALCGQPSVDLAQQLVPCALFHSGITNLPLWAGVQRGCQPALEPEENGAIRTDEVRRTPTLR